MLDGLRGETSITPSFAGAKASPRARITLGRQAPTRHGVGAPALGLPHCAATQRRGLKTALTLHPTTRIQVALDRSGADDPDEHCGYMFEIRSERRSCSEVQVNLA